MKLRTALLALLTAAISFAADASLLSLIPPGAKTVAGVNVDRTANSPFGQMVIGRMKDNDKFLQKIEENTGFDPRRDLREVLVVATTIHTPPAHDIPREGLVIVRGTFDIPRVLEMAQKEGAAITNYKDASVITSPGARRAGWVALLPSGLALIGDPEEVKAALDRRNQAPKIDAKLQSKVQELANRYDVWMVTSAPAGNFAGRLPTRELNRGVSPEMLESIEQASGGMIFGSNIEINGEAVTRSDKDATALADVVRFLTGMLQLNRDRPEAAHLSKLLDTLEIKTSANVMTLKLTIAQSDIDQLMKSNRPPRRAAR